MDHTHERPVDSCQVGLAAGAQADRCKAAAEGLVSLSLPEEALHIQAAAVAAQQGALTREEMRLDRRRQELAQQEQQLGEHLEQKLSRLVKLREEARQAHATLRAERTAYEKRVAQILERLAAERRGLADQDRQLQARREHLGQLHGRLRKRWRRNWKAERAGLAQRELEIDSRSQRIREERESLDRAHQELAREQTRFRVEAELGRRYLRSERERLRRLQSELDQREAALTQTTTASAEEARRLALEKRQWEEQKAERVRDAEALETRIANYRAKLDELARQTAQNSSLQVPAENVETTTGPTLDASLAAERAPVSVAREPDPDHDARVASQMAALERLAGEIADQRRCLVEGCLRFVRLRDQWQSDSQSAAAALDELGQRLQGLEQSLLQRELAVEGAEKAVQQKFDDLADAQKRLEGWRALLVAKASAWEGDRHKRFAELQSREIIVQERLAALSRLEAVWRERRRRQVLALRSQRNACEQLRLEYALLRDQWSSRMSALAQQQRGLAQRSLALDQYELEQVQGAVDAAGMDRRLKELRLRSAALSASEQRHFARERSRLEAETALLERRLEQLYKQEQNTLALEAELESKLSAWEKEQEARQAEQARRDAEVDNLRQERLLQEAQLQLLHVEVERLARLLAGEKDAPPLLLGRAA
jgi:hypothetical protein